MHRTLIATAFCCLVGSPALAADDPDVAAPAVAPDAAPVSPEGAPPVVSPDAAASGTAADVAAPGTGVATPEPARKDDVPEVRVVGDKADTLPKVPGSGTVISEKELKRAQPVETSEMLRRVPGIQAREDFGGGGRIDISVRGLDSGRSRRVLLLEDGMPMALNPYSEPDMYFAPAIERYRAIEVVKGSGNILFGPQTLAGTINFVTIAPPERRTAALDLDVGSFGYARGLARYGDTAGDTRYVVQVLHRRGDGYRHLPFDSTNVLGKIFFPTGESGSAVFKIGAHVDDAASDDVGLTAAMYRDNPGRAALSQRSHLQLERYDVGLTHEQRFSAAVSLKTLAYAYRTSREWARQDYSRTPRAGQTYERIVGDTTTPGGAVYFLPGNVVLDRSYDVAGLEPRLTVRAKTGDTRHTFDVGARGLLETAAYEQRQGSYPETFAGASENAEKRRGIGLAAYLQDRIAFTDRLLVTPGVRVEHLSYRRVMLRRFEGGAPRDVYEPGENELSGFIPGIGMVYGTRAAHGFFGLHRGFAPPRVTAAISPQGTPAKVGADESTNGELGARIAPSKWSKAEVAGFASTFQNQVIVNTDPSADVNLVDAGATLLRGVESGATIEVGRALRWETTVDVGLRYTYSRSTFRHGPNAGKLLPYAPEHAAGSNVDIEHPIGVGGQLSYTFVGPQFTDALNTVAEDVTGRVGRIDPWHIVNATAHYRHRPSGITVRLTVKNALDTIYISARRPEGIQPAGFRAIMLGLRWDWDARPRADTNL